MFQRSRNDEKNNSKNIYFKMNGENESIAIRIGIISFEASFLRF